MTDPPYVISKDSGFAKGGDSKFHSFQTDFGEWDHAEGFSMETLDACVQGMALALRPGGTAIVFFDLWKISTLMEMMERAGFVDLRMVEWEKTNPVPVNARASYLTNAREVAVYGVKPGAAPTLNDPPAHGKFIYSIEKAKGRFHPTQKSVPLFEHMLRVFSNPGDLVLDPFSGSGTTALVCKSQGRRFDGCELSPDYFEKSWARISGS